MRPFGTGQPRAADHAARHGIAQPFHQFRDGERHGRRPAVRAHLALRAEDDRDAVVQIALDVLDAGVVGIKLLLHDGTIGGGEPCKIERRHVVGKHQHRALLLLRTETLRKLRSRSEPQSQHSAHRHEQHIMRQRESLLRPLFRAFRLFILRPDGGGRHAALRGSFSFLFHNLIYSIKSRACHSFDAPFRSHSEIKGKKRRLRQISTPFPLFRPRFSGGRARRDVSRLFRPASPPKEKMTEKGRKTHFPPANFQIGSRFARYFPSNTSSFTLCPRLSVTA